ncbi:uncharacterized protein LOC127285705 [Leptopilina boulardi]|uniref:uncharacterized protein LOC127285705 n=1 Tax=Leptopilina boulardi TaxID=63433 RepID=UPI0021F5E5FE|nr:uncharacterized protein LOC127285705 [Leptopilina boulardi]
MKVCSLHFKKEDLFLQTELGNDKTCKKLVRLKKTSVPSQNLPQGVIVDKLSVNESARASRELRSKKRLNRFENSEFISNGDEQTQNDSAQEIDLRNENLIQEVDVQNDKCEEIDKNKIVGNDDFVEPLLEKSAVVQENSHVDVEVQVQTSQIDAAIQVASDFIIPQFSTFITTDQELSTMTGICDFKLLSTIEQLVKHVKSDNTSVKLNTRELIIMTCMKLKQNMSYAMLAILFKFKSQDNCKKRIFEMIDILNICLKPAIFWPSKENVLRNIPKCFQGFEQVRVVVDCTEIRIQRPANLCCQIQTYSYYKGNYTIKFMTGVTSAGLISFVSQAYGGRASDNSIFEQSAILNKLDKNDIVMADKGFTVEELCKKKDVSLLTPFFLRNKKQFSETEANVNRDIAKARVHVERANQRLKTFAILGDILPVCMISKIEEIFNIICGIVNLSAPILKNDKF